MDGIVNQLLITEGVEVAIFLYELDMQQYKVSLRSNKYIDVSRIAQRFSGGGHVRAAGCTMNGRVHDIINSLSGEIANQMTVKE